MKARFPRLMLALVMLLALCAGGCAGTLHKPTTPGNAGTSALVAYAVAGFTAGKYFALNPCATPPVYPCKVQSVNDRLLLADTAAYNAAKAADAAGATVTAKADAAKALAELNGENHSPAVKAQVDIANARSTP